MLLLTIDNPETLLAGEAWLPHQRVPVELPGTGFKRSVLKFKQISCCEVLGYQLALRLGVPMIPAVPVWCPRACRYMGQSAGEGRIGLAIQYCEAFDHVTWEQATSQNPKAVVASLVLCLLDRYEWGQFAATEIGLVFYDLERLFPAFRPERQDGETWEQVTEDLRDTVDQYGEVGHSWLLEVIDEADRLELVEAFRLAVADAATISTTALVRLFDLNPHPLAKRIGKMAAEVAVMQFKNAARLLGV